MINFGMSIKLSAMCPDCDKPMSVLRQAHAFITVGIDYSEFACVVCNTEDCMSRYFVTTIEKKSGMVVFTNARYIPDRGEDGGWKPIYAQHVDAEGNPIIK